MKKEELIKNKNEISNKEKSDNKLVKASCDKKNLNESDLKLQEPLEKILH